MFLSWNSRISCKKPHHPGAENHTSDSTKLFAQLFFLKLVAAIRAKLCRRLDSCTALRARLFVLTLGSTAIRAEFGSGREGGSALRTEGGRLRLDDSLRSLRLLHSGLSLTCPAIRAELITSW